MQVGVDDVGDLVRGGAGGFEPGQQQGVEVVHARGGTGFEAADAGVDQDDVAAGVHDPALDGDDEAVHVRHVVVGCEPMALGGDAGVALGLGDFGEQEVRRVGGAGVFDDAADAGAADHAGMQHVSQPSCGMLAATDGRALKLACQAASFGRVACQASAAKRKSR